MAQLVGDNVQRSGFRPLRIRLYWESLAKAPCFLLLYFMLAICFSCLSSGRDFDRLGNAISSRRVDLLARLGNLCEDGVVRKGRNDGSGLLLERDIIALNAYVIPIHVSTAI